jgi:hypothetical protein
VQLHCSYFSRLPLLGMVLLTVLSLLFKYFTTVKINPLPRKPKWAAISRDNKNTILQYASITF